MFMNSRADFLRLRQPALWSGVMLILFIPPTVMVGCLDIKKLHFPNQITGRSTPHITIIEDLMPFSRPSGDFGEFSSFVNHMKAIAIVCTFPTPSKINSKPINQERDVDLLLVDSGDLHDGVFQIVTRTLFLNILTGTGLTDGFPPGGVDAHDVRPKSTEPPEYGNILLQANQFIKELPYDIMTIGKSVVFVRRYITLFHNFKCYSFSHELYEYANTFDM